MVDEDAHQKNHEEEDPVAKAEVDSNTGEESSGYG